MVLKRCDHKEGIAHRINLIQFTIPTNNALFQQKGVNKNTNELGVHACASNWQIHIKIVIVCVHQKHQIVYQVCLRIVPSDPASRLDQQSRLGHASVRFASWRCGTHPYGHSDDDFTALFIFDCSGVFSDLIFVTWT